MSCQVITKDNKKYPKLLKKVGRDAPKQLYYKGSWDKDIFENCLAVVGSRRMTTYGKQVVEKIVGEVAAAGVTIVSGFMYGVDAAAHKAALKIGGRTIAVMPCGIDLIHPEYQQDLYVEILNNRGLVISEYEGNMQPVNWTYPRRNRIVAGLSKAALIVEAGEKSGSLITANFAKKFKRKVFVVPGPITSENTKGIMQLIKDGAEVVGFGKDILDYYKITASGTSQPKGLIQDLGGLEKEIAKRLQSEPLEIDAIARIFGIPAAKIGTTLSLMELRGLIKQEGGKYHSI
jgi:DNA processing protein